VTGGACGSRLDSRIAAALSALCDLIKVPRGELLDAEDALLPHAVHVTALSQDLELPRALAGEAAGGGGGAVGGREGEVTAAGRGQMQRIKMGAAALGAGALVLASDGVALPALGMVEASQQPLQAAASLLHFKLALSLSALLISISAQHTHAACIPRSHVACATCRTRLLGQLFRTLRLFRPRSRGRHQRR
jgi:hypothetical protein